MASDSVRTEAQPILANLVAANTERAEDSMAGQHPFWLLLIGLVFVGVLVWLNVMLARRFRRYVNAGIALAAVIVVVTTLVASIAAWRGDNQNDGLLDDELQVAIDQAAARTAGNDAKAYESLRLIKRGSGPTYEPKWEAAAAIVEDKAGDAASTLAGRYADGHQQIASLDDDDLWFKAKDIAIDEGEESTDRQLQRRSTPRRQGSPSENGDDDDRRAAGRTHARADRQPADPDPRPGRRGRGRPRYRRPAEGVRMSRPREARRRRWRRAHSLLAGCGYDDTPVPEKPAEPPHPGAAASDCTTDDDDPGVVRARRSVRRPADGRPDPRGPQR